MNENYRRSSWHAECIVSNDRRAVWKLQDHKEQLVLKYFRTNSALGVNLQQSLGLKQLAPEVIPLKNGSLSLRQDRYCLYVSRWIPGKVTTDPQLYMKTVAQFHREAMWSMPIERAAYGPLTKKEWFLIYENRLKKLAEWSACAETREQEVAFNGAIQLGRKALEILYALPVEEYLLHCKSTGTVTHFDFHRGNVLVDSSRSYVIDFDTVQIAPQVCDLHQVIPDLMDKMSVSPEQIGDLLHLYFQEHAAAQKYEDIYTAVCLFPLRFWKVAEHAVNRPLSRSKKLKMLPSILEDEILKYKRLVHKKHKPK